MINIENYGAQWSFDNKAFTFVYPISFSIVYTLAASCHGEHPNNNDHYSFDSILITSCYNSFAHITVYSSYYLVIGI